jgi:tetratricopeptide (TPR) repeat protein
VAFIERLSCLKIPYDAVEDRLSDMASDGEVVADEVCANCSKAAVDNIKLKICTACKLVKYCSVDCQKNHRPQHKKACKKRAAEIRDDQLFSQPDGTHYGECPICCLPLPLDETKRSINTCCCKYICRGCDFANQRREIEQGIKPRCTYCREPLPESKEEQTYTKRVEANDPKALYEIGFMCRNEGDYSRAFQYFTKAAGLGDIESHFELSVLYRKEQGVEKDEKKEIYHLEEAAIGGHPGARHNLGCIEHEKGRIDRSFQHWIIAAKLGYDESLAMVKEGFTKGLASKEEFEVALRGHQAAVDATKSDQREEAYAFYKQTGLYY